MNFWNVFRDRELKSVPKKLFRDLQIRGEKVFSDWASFFHESWLNTSKT